MADAQRRTTATSNGKKQFTLDLPMLSIQVRQPDVRLPHIEMPHIGMPHMPHMEMPGLSKQELGHYVDVARTFLPSRERMAYYGALGALAAFGVLEWPVAAAIGAGTIIAQRRQGAPAFGRPRATARAAKPSTPSGRATTTRRETTAAAKPTTTRRETTAAAKPSTTTAAKPTTTRRGTATTTAGAGGRKTTTTTAGAGGRKATTRKTTSTSSSTSRRKSTSPSR
ncbi:hypothetical protein [Nonomuraea sp. NPDC049784]|uniref:hypothetical protein n=1 Tax=Nonomuraea sp. NPDC049784 TaxID=3154361 RepID=UPI00340A7EAD